MSNWKVVAESALCLNCRCDRCNEEHHGLGIEGLVSSGVPVCLDCDEEMTLQYCEVDKDKL